MVCSKCGFEAGNAKFCPKCGNPINSAPVETQAYETPVVEPVATPVVESPVVETPVATPAYGTQQDTYGQSQYGAQQNAYGESQFGAQQNVYGQTQFGAQQNAYGQQGGVSYDSYGSPRGQQFGAGFGDVTATPLPPVNKPKKKKWPFVVAIIAVLAVVAAVLAVIFVVPKFKNKHAKAAVKKVGSSLESSVSDVFDNSLVTSVFEKSEIKGTIKVDKLTYNSEDAMSYVNFDSVAYDIQLDQSTGNFAGDIKLMSKSNTALLSCNFYSDGYTVYFKVPELFNESFKISLDDVMGDSYYGYNYSIGSLMGSGSLDTAQMQLMETMVESVVKDIAKGIDVFADKCEYKNNGKKTFNTDNGDIAVTDYTITVTQEALTEGFNAIVDALYEDSNVSSYMSMLALYGMNKESLKSLFKSSLSGYKPVSATMYVDKNDTIVKLGFVVDGVNIDVSFIGTTHRTDYIVFEMKEDDTSIKMYINSSDNKASVGLGAKSGSEYMDFDLTLSASGNKVTIENYSMSIDIDDVKLDIALSGDYTISEFNSMSYSSSSYPNSLNLDYITSSQETQLMNELTQKRSVLENILSKKALDSVIK